MTTSTTIQADIVFIPNSKKQYQDLQEFYDSVYPSTHHQLDSVHNDSGSGAHYYASPFNDYFLKVKNVSGLQKMTRLFKQNAQSDWLFVKVENYFQPSGDCGYVFFYKDENGDILQRVLSKSGFDSLRLCYTHVGHFVKKEYSEYINFIHHISYRYCSRENPSDLGLFEFMSSEKFKVLIDELKDSDDDLKKKLFLLILAKFFKDRFETFKDYFKNLPNRLIKRGLNEECGVSCKRIESPNIGHGSAKVIIQRHAIAGDNTPKVVYLKIKKYNLLDNLQDGKNYRDLSLSDDRLKKVYCFIKVTFKDNGQAEIDGSNIYFCKANEPHVKTAKSIETIPQNYRRQLLKDIVCSSPIKIESYLQTNKDLAIQTDVTIKQYIKEYQFNYSSLSFSTCGDSSENSISSDNSDLSSSHRSGQLQSGINSSSQRNSADTTGKTGSDFIFLNSTQTRGGFSGASLSGRASVSASLVRPYRGQWQSATYDPLLRFPANISAVDSEYQRHSTSKEAKRNPSGLNLHGRVSKIVSSLEGARGAQHGGQYLSASLVHQNLGQRQSGINYSQSGVATGPFAEDGSDRRNGALRGGEGVDCRSTISGGFLKKPESLKGRVDMSPSNRRSLTSSLVHISPREESHRSEGGDSLIDRYNQRSIVNISSDDPVGRRYNAGSIPSGI